jgi:hypothetical protein
LLQQPSTQLLARHCRTLIDGSATQHIANFQEADAVVQATVSDQYNLTTAALASSLKDVCRNFHADKYLDVKALDLYNSPTCYMFCRVVHQ